MNIKTGWVKRKAGASKEMLRAEEGQDLSAAQKWVLDQKDALAD
tara:strand:+ start:677 stop:808 length:132 start_codon:yes stop_codon:yes gene_type:complete